MHIKIMVRINKIKRHAYKEIYCDVCFCFPCVSKRSLGVGGSLHVFEPSVTLSLAEDDYGFE
jgi:hypothetical protein